MSAPSVWLTTLGCSKNQVDSEKLSSVLTESGYRLAAAPEEADVVMVNTCAFIEDARRESVETILEAAATKRVEARTVVIGCLAQRFGPELAEALPEVDAVLGLDRYADLVPTLDGLTGWQPVRVRRRPAMDILSRVRRPDPALPYAYVKVAEGCDKACTFCAIPLIRGPQVSRRPTNIRREVEDLCAAGVREVVLVAQDLAAYGRDIGAPGGITDLVRFLSGVEGLDRMRLLYLYPSEIRPALIDEMVSNPKVASYFDLSLQHVSARLLRAMRRPGDADRHAALVDRIREADPDAALRSSFIVGFPGETDDDVEALAGFLSTAELDWAGFFPFSPEEGTVAATLEGGIGTDEVAERLRYLQGIQEEVTARRNAARVGLVERVLVDQVEDGVRVGRTHRHAPEIDGIVTVDGGEPGTWVQARIVGAYGTDLAGEVVG